MPEPILVSIAAAVASKAVGSLYELVKQKFANKRDAAAALEVAEGAAPDSDEVEALGEELARVESSDPAFSAELRALWREATLEQYADRGGVVNQITGQVTGKVVQARDIEGGVSF